VKDEAFLAAIKGAKARAEREGLDFWGYEWTGTRLLPWFRPREKRGRKAQPEPIPERPRIRRGAAQGSLL
jgi:hypothetical protein